MNRQRGFAHPSILILLIVLVGVGVIGYKVAQSHKPATKNTSAESAQTATKSWAEGSYAVEGTYADASIVQTAGDEWRLYYAVQPEVQGNNLEVYSATSNDGKTWVQEPGTRKTMATFPEVVKNNDGSYRMYFQSAGVIKSASSADGLTFTDDSGTRIDKSNDLSLAFDNVAAPAVLLQDDGSYLMVYRGTVNTRYAADTPNSATQVLLWATSPDGLSWTKKGMAIDSRNDTLSGQLDGPNLVKWDDGKIHLFATTYDGVYESVFDGSAFQAGEITFALDSPKQPNGEPAKYGIPPGDPSLAKINGTWFMYYGATGSNSGIHYATYK